jgi:hypothetical protein
MKDKPKNQPLFTNLGNLVQDYQIKKSKGYVSVEFQDFGYRLAVSLDDLAHKALYIKMAKNEDRGLLERALSFVSDASSARSKARLFMWKLRQLKDEQSQLKTEALEEK